MRDRQGVENENNLYRILLHRGIPDDPNVGYAYVANATDTEQYLELVPSTTAPAGVQGREWEVCLF